MLNPVVLPSGLIFLYVVVAFLVSKRNCFLAGRQPSPGDKPFYGRQFLPFPGIEPLTF